MNDGHTTESVRDEWLGARLRELDVPRHRADFSLELRRRLDAERRTRRRRTALRWSVRVAVPAAVAALAIALAGLPGGGSAPALRGPQAASAAVVKARVRAALATLRSLSGTLVASDPAAGTTARFRFALDAAGDLRLEGPRPGDLSTYDARTGVVRSLQHSASLGGDARFAAERTGVAPGAPDQGPPTWVLPEQYGAFVRAALHETPTSVRATTYDGRPAWSLEVATTPDALVPEVSGDRLAITVDRASGMPVRVVETKAGATLHELRIEDLAVDPELPASTFALAFPAGAEVMRSDDGFRRVALDGVAAASGYRPLAPSWLPDGYRLAEVAVARTAAATGRGGGNPPSRMVVALSYRRGVDQLLVTTRLRGEGAWSDPLALDPGSADAASPLRLASGALAGAEAEVVLAPGSAPHLWALTDELVVTVSGDLDRAELARVAASLRAR
jgi:hypothetical protein